jgi:hypothetical protein
MTQLTKRRKINKLSDHNSLAGVDKVRWISIKVGHLIRLKPARALSHYIVSQIIVIHYGIIVVRRV